MLIYVKRSKRCIFPPTGKPIAPPGTTQEFEDIGIKVEPVERLRPEGVRQPEAERNVMSRIRAVQQLRAPITLDPIR